jgi:hypothetical protein
VRRRTVDDSVDKATEVTIAGIRRPQIVWGLTPDRLAYMRAKWWPRKVTAEPIVPLDELFTGENYVPVIQENGVTQVTSYPGTYGLEDRIFAMREEQL